MQVQHWLVVSALLVGMFLSVKAGKMTLAGALTGGLLGFAIFLGSGFTGLTMLGTFFILGSFVTSWGFNDKAKAGLAEENKGRRKASQALANGGIAGMLGLIAWLYPPKAELVRLMLAASFSSATADTCSSELGNVYGRRFYNILTLRPDTKGLNGVISLEGTLLGFLGSCLISVIYGVSAGWGWPIAWILIAGTAGNITDSVLGASLERKHYLQNDAVNFLNTLVGALVALGLYVIFS